MKNLITPNITLALVLLGAMAAVALRAAARRPEPRQASGAGSAPFTVRTPGPPGRPVPLSRCRTYFTSCTPMGATLLARSATASTGQRKATSQGRSSGWAKTCRLGYRVCRSLDAAKGKALGQTRCLRFECRNDRQAHRAGQRRRRTALPTSPARPCAGTRTARRALAAPSPRYAASGPRPRRSARWHRRQAPHRGAGPSPPHSRHPTGGQQPRSPASAARSRHCGPLTRSTPAPPGSVARKRA